MTTYRYRIDTAKRARGSLVTADELRAEGLDVDVLAHNQVLEPVEQPTSNMTQAAPAAPGVAWELGPPTSSWRGWSPEAALRESLEVAARLDARRAAEHAPAGSPPSGSTPAAPAPAPPPDPSRSWVRP